VFVCVADDVVSDTMWSQEKSMMLPLLDAPSNLLGFGGRVDHGSDLFMFA
jgi:hypothetical protein